MIAWRVRTEYSFGDTFAPIKLVVPHLKELGYRAAAITDRHGTWGHVPWYKACREAGIQPMLGVELIVDEHHTMAFVARNLAGLREMYGFTSLAHTRGSTPKLTKDDVRAISSNVIKFAGDVLDGDFLAEVGAVIDLSPASIVARVSKQRIAKEHKLRTVNCCDNAYVREQDKPIFEIAVPRGARPTAQHLFAVDDDNDDLLPEDFELAHAPLIHIPDAMVKLWKLVREGIDYRARMNGLVWDAEHEERLVREMGLIEAKNFASYFLVVADMCAFAKTCMLVGPSRGSAAGSLACYLARITEIDPIPPQLIFERFIDVTREDLPDIDLDFPDKKRHLVFEYMAQKYGAANVAHIGTIARYQAKSSLVTACKRMGIPQSVVTSVKIAMIERSSADQRVSDCLRDTLDTTEPGRKLKKMYPEIMLAADLEGHASHTGVHAAGLLVCNEPITNYCTVTGEGIAQLEKYSAETLGLLKIDVLGLRTLSVLEEANVLSNDDWYALPLNDPDTFKIFDSQELSGIFQFEGDALRDVSKRMVPFKSMHDVDAVTALARPGPFASGITQQYLQARNEGIKVKVHPLVEEHMRNTHGLPIYQEQTLLIVRNIGKFSWEDSARIRRLISRRMGTEYFETFWRKFRDGAMENGLEEKDAREIWDSINTMGSWQMNKAHTYSYAVLSYWTAWLKAHHPTAFALSCLRSGLDQDQAKALKLIREMTLSGRIRHLPMDWRRAAPSWSIVDGALMPGIDSAVGFGSVLAEKFVEARETGKLTAKQIEKVEAAEKLYDSLFPMEEAYASYYEGKEKVAGGITRLKEITGEQEGSAVLLGKIIHKSLRDVNEDANIRKRGGKMLGAPFTYLDLRIADDTDQLLVRIDRYDYERMGKEVFNNVPVGAVLLLRVRLIQGYRFGWVSKWRRIDGQ